MIRSILSSVMDGADVVIKRFSGSGRTGETFESREYFQHYGFTSRPLQGAEGILLKDGNNIILVASDDRRYRLKLENGEVALYTDEGDRIYLKRGRHVEVHAGEKVTISTKVADVSATTSAKVTSPQIDVIASSKVKIDSPAVEITGNLTVGGTAAVSGALSSSASVADPTGTMAAMRETYNNHKHTDPQGGTTGTPDARM